MWALSLTNSLGYPSTMASLTISSIKWSIQLGCITRWLHSLKPRSWYKWRPKLDISHVRIPSHVQSRFLESESFPSHLAASSVISAKIIISVLSVLCLRCSGRSKRLGLIWIWRRAMSHPDAIPTTHLCLRRPDDLPWSAHGSWCPQILTPDILTCSDHRPQRSKELSPWPPSSW